MYISDYLSIYHDKEFFLSCQIVSIHIQLRYSTIEYNICICGIEVNSQPDCVSNGPFEEQNRLTFILSRRATNSRT